MKNVKHERTPLYALGQLDALVPGSAGIWKTSITQKQLNTFRQTFIDMYALLILAEKEILSNADELDTDPTVALEIRAFLRGEDPEGVYDE